jgi:hypothetical protein
MQLPVIAMITLAVVAALLGGIDFYRRGSGTPATPIDWRSLLARLPLPMLALAASYGVYSFATLFVPPWVAGIQAAAFELTYIGLAVTRGLDGAQRKRATAISIGAVVASIVYNTLAGWFHKQAGLLDTASPIAWLMFAILHGAPLAWVAYLVADLLLHSGRRSDRPKELRALIKRLARLLRTVRAAAAPLEVMLAQARAELETVRAMLQAQGNELAQALIEAAQANADRESWQRQAAQNGEDTARAMREFARVSREQELSAREFDQVAAQLREEAAIARAASSLDVLAVARRMVAANVPLREIAPLTGLAESTLRGRLKATANGHAVEA